MVRPVLPRRVLAAMAAVAVVAVSLVVPSSATAAATELRVLSFNLLRGGSESPDGRAKQLRFIRDTGADVVGIQENDYAAARELAAALGWHHADANSLLGSDVAVISRHPITSVRVHGFGYLGIRVGLRVGNQHVTIWNVHLSAFPYAPYSMCFGQRSEAAVVADEYASARVPQMQAILGLMVADLANTASVPVLFTGDFNTPSHLDYTAATAGRHCGYQRFLSPVTLLAANVGLRDSYRVANPDPAAAPGDTWSPVAKLHGGGAGWDDHIGDPEPQDRIDYVMFKGNLRVSESRALWVGTPGPDPSHNEWTSDHAAVLTTFHLTG